MDLSSFKISDWLKVGGGALFLIAGPLTWWKITFDGGLFFDSDSANAHGLGDYFGTVGIAWLIFIAIAVLTVLLRLGIVKAPSSLPVPLVFLAAAAAARSGLFDEAIPLIERAIAAAPDDTAREDFERRRAAYRAGRAWSAP